MDSAGLSLNLIYQFADCDSAQSAASLLLM